jgi:hypothetical protein
MIPCRMTQQLIASTFLESRNYMTQHINLSLRAARDRIARETARLFTMQLAWQRYIKQPLPVQGKMLPVPGSVSNAVTLMAAPRW